MAVAKKELPTEYINIAIVGDKDTGVLSLRRRLVEGTFTPYEKSISKHGSTFYTTLNQSGREIKLAVGSEGDGRLLDTKRTYFEKTSVISRGANAFIIAVDVTNKRSLDSIEQYVKKIRADYSEQTPITIVATKNDLPEAIHAFDLKTLQAKAKELNVPLVVGSSKTGEGLGNVLRETCHQVRAQRKQNQTGALKRETILRKKHLDNPKLIARMRDLHKKLGEELLGKDLSDTHDLQKANRYNFLSNLIKMNENADLKESVRSVMLQTDDEVINDVIAKGSFFNRNPLNVLLTDILGSDPELFYKKALDQQSPPGLSLRATMAHQTLAFDTKDPITYQNRFKELESVPNSPYFALSVGTTYSSSAAGSSHEGKVLDSVHGAYTTEGDNITGLVIAVADGFGGHRSAAEDDDIATAAQIATQLAATELSKFSSPDELTDEVLIGIANKIGDAINSTGRGQSTTLACGRVFIMPDGQRQFVGFNVGDSLIATWNPKEKKVQTLLPGVNDGRSPAPINGFNKDECRIARAVLSEHDKLFAMTDGVYEEVAKETPFTNSKGAKFKSYELDEEKITAILTSLPEDLAVNEYSKALLTAAAALIDEQKDKSAKKGDDAAMAVFDLSTISFTEAASIHLENKKLLEDAVYHAKIYEGDGKAESDYTKARTNYTAVYRKAAEQENYVDQFRSIIGLGQLNVSLSHHLQKHPSGFQQDLKQRVLPYALQLVELINKTPAYELESLRTHHVLTEVTQFLQQTLKTSQSVPTARWEMAEKKEDVESQIENAISQISSTSGYTLHSP